MFIRDESVSRSPFRSHNISVWNHVVLILMNTCNHQLCGSLFLYSQWVLVVRYVRFSKALALYRYRTRCCSDFRFRLLRSNCAPISGRAGGPYPQTKSRCCESLRAHSMSSGYAEILSINERPCCVNPNVQAFKEIVVVSSIDLQERRSTGMVFWQVCSLPFNNQQKIILTMTKDCLQFFSPCLRIQCSVFPQDCYT